MLVEKETSSVIKEGVKETSSFQIKASPKAFRILSDGLYSDKIKAIVRELSTNAYDAHVEVGKKDVPFDVHLPTTFEPWFSIRDYGPGLSHNDLMKIYTTYFESTKTNSNDFVGALGLGSKSPFCYTDQFTVESFYNGEHRTYVAAIEEDQWSVNLFTKIKTTEPNGLKVTVPVQKQDLNAFAHKANDVYKWFDTLPNVSGYDGQIEKVLDSWYLDKSKRFYFRVGLNSRVSRNLKIKMGNVVYTVSDLYDIFENSDDFSFIYVGDVVINANIGDVDIASSRESLGNTEKTKNFLKKEIEFVSENLSQNIREYIQNRKNWLEAKACFDSIQITRLYRNESIRNLKYKNFQLNVYDIEQFLTSTEPYNFEYWTSTFTSNWEKFDKRYFLKNMLRNNNIDQIKNKILVICSKYRTTRKTTVKSFDKIIENFNLTSDKVKCAIFVPKIDFEKAKKFFEVCNIDPLFFDEDEVTKFQKFNINKSSLLIYKPFSCCGNHFRDMVRSYEINLEDLSKTGKTYYVLVSLKDQPHWLIRETFNDKNYFSDLGIIDKNDSVILVSTRDEKILKEWEKKKKVFSLEEAVFSWLKNDVPKKIYINSDLDISILRFFDDYQYKKKSKFNIFKDPTLNKRISFELNKIQVNIDKEQKYKRFIQNLDKKRIVKKHNGFFDCLAEKIPFLYQLNIPRYRSYRDDFNSEIVTLRQLEPLIKKEIDINPKLKYYKA